MTQFVKGASDEAPPAIPSLLGPSALLRHRLLYSEAMNKPVRSSVGPNYEAVICCLELVKLDTVMQMSALSAVGFHAQLFPSSLRRMGVSDRRSDWEECAPISASSIQ
jgi:hypothetical protein